MSDHDERKPDAPGAPDAGDDAHEPAGEEPKPAATGEGPAEEAAAGGETEAGEKPAGEEKEPAAAAEGGAEDEAAAKAKAEAAAKAKAEAAAKAKAQAAAAAKAKAEAEAAKPPWERDPVVPEWQEAGDDPLAAALAAAHGETLLAARAFAGDLVLEVAPGGLVELATDLRDGHGFKLLVDVCGAHYPQREEEPLEVVYHLYSFEANRRVRLKVATADGAPVPSLTGVWGGANWPEREAWDMYGIRFEGHPDMTRILMWEGFNGHPLRKEFPVEGIDTGAAIYPEYYDEEAGPVAGTGTGWKPTPPPEPPAEEETAPPADES